MMREMQMMIYLNENPKSNFDYKKTPQGTFEMEALLMLWSSPFFLLSTSTSSSPGPPSSSHFYTR